MLTVDDYGKIRIAHRDGLSVRAIARTFHHSRRKVREALINPEPRGYTRRQEPSAPKLGLFKGFIDQILLEDEAAPRKQRHTAVKIFRRLRAEQGYQGGYDQVRRYLRQKRRREQETFIPLAHAPGQRLEADFGHIYVDFPQGRRQVPVLLNTWSYSGFPFALAVPTERIEAILAGMVQALEFFDCGPHEVWWDNPRTVARAILRGRERRLQERYAALASHYRFEPLFCMVARGNEKPYVENSVYDLQRDWATPVPRVKDYSELNDYLRQCCLKKLEHRVAGQSETIGVRFAREKAAALALPERPFDPCVTEEARVDKYQTVRFDTNGYTVPRRWAFEMVTVKAYIDHIAVVARGAIIAAHQRCYERGQKIVQPEHYLAILGRRPGALDHSGVFRQWQLPACFNELRELLEERQGSQAGSRQYIRVLQLLAEHPARRVQQAIEHCRHENSLHAELIIQYTQRLSQRPESGPFIGPEELTPPAPASLVQVPWPDLRRFDQLLPQTQGVPNHVGIRNDVVESPSQAVASAHDAGGVRKALPGGRPGEC